MCLRVEQGKSYEAHTHLVFSTSLQVEAFITGSICFVLFVVSLQKKVDKFANVAYKTKKTSPQITQDIKRIVVSCFEEEKTKFVQLN